MIIGLEHICFGLLIVALLLCLAAIILKKGWVILASLATISLFSSLALFAGISSAQDYIAEHYVDYLKLQVQVAKYDDLDMLEQYKVRDDVMTYNLWYEKNESDLENEWSFKGTSEYAKEFDYIIIGG